MRSKALLQAKLFVTHLRRQRARMFLTATAIVVGVASITAILTLNRSAYRSFEDAVTAIAGRAQFEIANGSVGVPDDLLAKIRATPGVHAAAGVVQQFVRLPALDNRTVSIFAVDLAGDSRVWGGLFDLDTFDIPDELELLDDSHAVLLSETLLRGGHYQVGDTITVTSPGGTVDLAIRGSFSNQRFADVFQGDVAIMDVHQAQPLFGKERRFDWIHASADEGANLEEIGARIAGAVGGYGQVASPKTRGRRIEAMLRSNRWMLSLSSLFAAAVGLFLVAQSMYTSTIQRTAVYATLRSLGASRGQLATLVLVEASLLAVVGSIVGVAIGLAVCKLALGPFGIFLSITYAQVKPSALAIDLRDLATALGVGVGATLAGAIGPSLSVTTMSPMASMRRSRKLTARWTSRYVILGSALCVFALLVPSIHLPRPWFAAQTAQAFTAIVIMILGAALLTPATMRLAGVALQPALRRAWGSVGYWLWQRIAIGDQRTLLTVSALAAGFSFATLMSVFVASYRTAVVDYLEESFPADVILNVGPPMSMLSGPVASLELAEEVQALPQVASVSPLRFVEATFAGQSIVVQGIGDEIIRHRFSADALDFDSGEVIVSDTLMERYGLDVGSRFTLDTPTGPIELIVRIVEPDYFLDLGSVKLPWSVFAKRWQERAANVFLVQLRANADPAKLKATIDSKIGERYDLTILTRDDTRVAINTLIDSTFALMFLCEGLAILVAIIAVMNGIGAALLDRSDQLRVLRAVGLTPRGLHRLIALEGALVGVMGGAIGIVAGGAVTHQILTHSWRAVAGFHMPVLFPGFALGIGLLAAVVSGALAGHFAYRGFVRTEHARNGRVTPVLLAEQP